MSAEFNKPVDYFGIESATLKLVSSNDGATRNLTTCAHYGPIEASEISATVYNPSCVYEVVGAMTLGVTLGTMSTLNAMITGVEIETALGTPPRVTVSATANEGAAAINKFAVSIALTPRHRPQILANCCTDTYNDLQSCKLSATCDATVLWEAGAPCASDISKGRMTATCEFFGNAGAAGSGWTDVGAPISGESTGYRKTERSYFKALAVQS